MRKKTEANIQNEIIIYIARNLCKTHAVFSVPNEGAKVSTKFIISKMNELIKTPSRVVQIANQVIKHCLGNAVGGMIMKSMGMMSGVSDLILLSYKEIKFIEVKKPGGVQSKTQKLFQKLVERFGFEYHIVKSVEDFKTIIK